MSGISNGLPINLANLNFGALAAEYDINEGLQNYFVESESFRRLRDGKKTIALGNRGSGKSAIFKMIAEYEKTRKSIVIEMSPENYSYELLSQVMTSESKGSWAKQGAYAAAWKYLIYVTAMKAISNTKGLKTQSAGRIYNYIRDNHGNFDKNPIGTLISYLKRLEGIKIGPYEASFKAVELQKLYRLEEVEHLLEDMNVVCQSKNVTILIDELDRGWDASEDAIAFVAGLFQAANAINSRTPNLRVLVSLRRELYENIPALYEDAQKVRDSIEIIEWQESQLLELISRRIAKSYEIPFLQDPMDAWNLVFSDVLQYRQTKSFNYIVDRTLYRPRELIQFCSLIRDKASSAILSPPIDYRVISEAENDYSDQRLKDIASEYRFQYPGLLSLFESFRGLTFTFDRSSLEFHCLKIATGDYTIDSKASWALDKEPDQMIKIFWSIGFLRARAIGGIKARQQRGSSYLGPHQISSMDLKNITYFHVHPMFRTFLGMRESKSASQRSFDEG